MPKTSNQELLDALVRHQIYLTRVSGSIRDRVIAILDAVEEDIAAAVERRLGSNRGFDTESASRLRVLESIIGRLRGGAWDRVDEEWFASLAELAAHEGAFMAATLTAASPVHLDLLLPSPATLRAAARATPMEGRVLRDWASRQRQADLGRIMSSVQIGMVQGEDSRDIARRVVGTRQFHKTDGATHVTRREAEALTRTAVNHVANAARREFINENAELFELEMFVATLDSRTTPICRATDGKRFPVGKGPIPPLHFSCRSTRVPLLDGEVLGERPMKPVTEQMLVREFSRKRGLGDLSSRDDLPRGTKGDFDKFARGRVRELVGRVPASTSYQEWLAGQSAEFQDDVLGKARGALFRRGGLSLDRFVNRAGDQIPLSELARVEREAFARAGLDPGSYL
jgi:SPP1 gp7 family putative phage head morphogenesis protein